MGGKSKTATRYAINSSLSSRINFLRIAAIVMVAFIHVHSGEVHFADGNMNLQTPAWLDNFEYITADIICRSAIPLFFLISGFLLYSKEFTWWDNVKRKCKTLLLPYFIWNTLWILFYLLAQMLPFTARYFTNEGIIIRNWGVIDVLKAYFTLNNNQSPFLYTFWFMRDLFILNLLAGVIKWLTDKLPVTTLCAVGIIWFADISPVLISNKGLCFFVLGCLIVKYRCSIKDIDKFHPLAVTAVYAGAIIWDRLVGTALVHGICVVVGIVFLLRISALAVKTEQSKRRIGKLSGYVFFVYALHEMNLTILKKLLVRFLPQTTAVQLLEFIGIPLVIVTLCVIAGMCLKRIAPKTYALLTGGR